jgi:mRNA interferase MazF
MKLRRGHVVLVKLGDKNSQSLYGGTRPCLIVQNNIGNEHSPNVIVAAIAARAGSTLYPVNVLVAAGEGGLKVDSVVDCAQVYTVSQTRVANVLGQLGPENLSKVDKALKISLGLL